MSPRLKEKIKMGRKKIYSHKLPIRLDDWLYDIISKRSGPGVSMSDVVRNLLIECLGPRPKAIEDTKTINNPWVQCENCGDSVLVSSIRDGLCKPCDTFAINSNPWVQCENCGENSNLPVSNCKDPGCKKCLPDDPRTWKHVREGLCEACDTAVINPYAYIEEDYKPCENCDNNVPISSTLDGICLTCRKGE